MLTIKLRKDILIDKTLNKLKHLKFFKLNFNVLKIK
jgi:hypothetical protein